MAEQRSNSGRTPKDESAYRRDRRAAVLAHHPDHGGSADALIEALEAVDRKHGLTPDRDKAKAASEQSFDQALAVVVTAAAGIVAVGASLALSIASRKR